jgi:predicted nuclease of restriction endonuclease-like (RecB) superfamily
MKPPNRRKSHSIPGRSASPSAPPALAGYEAILAGVTDLLENARRASARAVNAVMTATYWEIGRRVVVCEQRGEKRAGYGKALLGRLSGDLTARFGRGFSVDNLELMRLFYETYPPTWISESLSRKSGLALSDGQNSESPIREFGVRELANAFPLPWSHYVHLLRKSGSAKARAFYESEALRGGWSVRQLVRQINALYYERTLLSRNKAAMLTKGAKPKLADIVTPEEEIKDPLVLEFLGLKDEYSESELEAALIRRLEDFLLELGGDFAFIGRQRRLRVGDVWYRVDLLFFHRRLRALVVVDLKIGEFTHADAGQMHLYLNYAREHWVHEGENPPVGLILCTGKDAAVAHYALDRLPDKVLAAQYRLALPDEKTLAVEVERARKVIESRGHLPAAARQSRGSHAVSRRMQTNEDME